MYDLNPMLEPKSCQLTFEARKSEVCVGSWKITCFRDFMHTSTYTIFFDSWQVVSPFFCPVIFQKKKINKESCKSTHMKAWWFGTRNPFGVWIHSNSRSLKSQIDLVFIIMFRLDRDCFKINLSRHWISFLAQESNTSPEKLILHEFSPEKLILH